MVSIVPSGILRGTRFLLVVAGLMIAATIVASPARADMPDPADEMLFYRSTDGTYRYYNVSAAGQIGTLVSGGVGYSKGWTSITAIDLDGGVQDEILFYRSTDGTFRYYNIGANGQLGPAINGGIGYSKGWTSITAIDLDDDGQDEILFYRSTDGTFRYYNIGANGQLGPSINGGIGYTTGWTTISAVDLDGDGQDEILFYRSTDGTFRYYNIGKTGQLGSALPVSDTYEAGWTSITPVDIDNDRRSELFFYRSSDGAFRYNDVGADGQLGAVINEGTGYSPGWSLITGINLEGDLPVERVSRFTTSFQCCQPRVTNIRTMARALNGHVVMPGETFSINTAVGPTTASKGYVLAPYLLEGEGQCCAVGGGVSQFGTTMYNAVFWGGYKVVEHQPHSGWISRYPLGIEATLVYSSINLRFTNDTVTPVTIRTSSTGTSVTVELWGNQGGWQIRGSHPIGARSSVLSVLDQGGTTAKRVSARVTGSAPGVVKVVRTLVQGGIAKTQTWFWNYVS